jgi:type VI protein secretion system component Hcp
MAYYLVINGIPGDYSDKLLSGAFAVDSFEFQSQNTATFSQAAQTTFDPLWLRLSSQTYAGLLAYEASGKHITDVSLVEEVGGSLIAYDLNLTTVTVTDVREQPKYDIVDVTLSYDQIGLVTDTPQTFGWDLTKNASTGSGTPLTSGGTTLGPTAPVNYFLLIDGLNGGSQDKTHTGWFEIQGSSIIDLSNTSGTGKGTFGDLSVTLAGNSGLRALLANEAPGAHLKGVKLEGVSAGGVPVYDLELTTVVVNSIDNAGGTGSGTQVSFGYQDVGLVTSSPDGSTTGSFGWDTLANKAIDPAAMATLNVGTTNSTTAADHYYLVINGIAGDYSDKLLSGAFAVDSFKFQSQNTGTVSQSAKTTFDQLELKLSSQTYAGLLAYEASGKHIPDVSLVGELGGSLITYDLNLSNVSVTAVSATSGGSVTVTLSYDQIGLVTEAIKPDGSLDTPQKFGWDLTKNASTGSGTSLTSGGTTLGPTAAVNYFLLIDGLNGGSLDQTHAGWFEIQSFSIDLANTSGTSKGTFEDLSVTIGSNSGLTALLANEAPGTHLKGVKLEGVSAGGVPVYDLELTTVVVNSIVNAGETDGSVTRISFGCQDVGLTTSSADGSTTGSFGWDALANKAIDPAAMATLNVGTTSDATAADHYYLVINGIAGDYSDKLLSGAFAVTNFDFVSDNDATFSQAAKTNFDPLDLTLSSHAYAGLLAYEASGKHINHVSLVGEVGGGSQASLITYDLNLSNVSVTQVSAVSGGVNVTLSYDQIGLVTEAQQFGWDLTKNASTSSGTSLTSGGTTLGSTAPTNYFLLIDGLYGGSQDKTHAGWFEIQQFSIDLANNTSGTGKGTFGDLAVKIADNTALTALLTDESQGKHLKGVKLEGVTSAGTVVYDLELTTVVVNSIDDQNQLGYQPGYSISFGYQDVGVVTSAPDGSTTGAFGWDTLVNQAIDPTQMATLNAGAPCYCPDTLILTDRGDVAVETLSIGDHVMTMSGAARPIRWIGRRSYSGRFAVGQKDILPICIKAGAIDDNVPRRDLWISPHHAMYLNGVLIEARNLVNGASIVQAKSIDKVEYFHIELETHDVIIAEGALSESFINDDSRNMFHNAHEYATLYPDGLDGAAHYCAPRLDCGYEIEAARHRIAVRAGLTRADARTAGPLRGHVDIVSMNCIAGWAQAMDYPEAPVCLDIYAGGRLIGQTLANGYREDLKRVGIGSGRHAFMFTPSTGLDVNLDFVEVRRSLDGAVLQYRTVAVSRLSTKVVQPPCHLVA